MKRLYTGFEGPWANQNATLNLGGVGDGVIMPLLKNLEPELLGWFNNGGHSSNESGGNFTAPLTRLNDRDLRLHYTFQAPTVYSLSSYPIKQGSCIGPTGGNALFCLGFPLSSFSTGFYCSFKMTNPDEVVSGTTWYIAMRVEYGAPTSNQYFTIACSSGAQQMSLTHKTGTILTENHIPKISDLVDDINTDRGADHTFNFYVKPTGEFYGEMGGASVYYNFGWNPLSGTGPSKIYIGPPSRGGGASRTYMDDLMINDGKVKAFFTDTTGTGYGATGYAILSAGLSTTIVDYLSVTNGGRDYTGPVRVTLDLESFTLPFSASDPSISGGIVQNDVTILSAGTDIVGNDTGLPNPYLRGYNWVQSPKHFLDAGWEQSGSDLTPKYPSNAVHDYNNTTRAKSSRVGDELGYEFNNKTALLSGMSQTQDFGPVNMWIGGTSRHPNNYLTTRLGVSGTSPLSATANIDLPNNEGFDQLVMYTHDKLNRTFTANSLSALQASIKVQ